jgi:DNA modification methylase
MGLEFTPDEFVTGMVAVFREVRRVLRDDGTLWLNLGDSYTATGGNRNNYPGNGPNSQVGKSSSLAMPRSNRADQRRGTEQMGLKQKDLVGMPWRLAFALQADGWYLRSDIIWHKPNPMPESVTDRPTKSHEYVFLLTKAARYFYDADAVRETAVYDGPQLSQKRGSFGGKGGAAPGLEPFRSVGTHRNARTVWTIATAPFPKAHFATFPLELPARCIRAGTSEEGCCPKCGAPWERLIEKEFQRQDDVSEANGIRGHAGQKPMDESSSWGGVPRGSTHSTTIGWQTTCECECPDTLPCTVLDPFSGAGTTGLAALRLGRDYIGIELNPEYAEMSKRRIRDDAPLLNRVEVCGACPSADVVKNP